MYYIIEIQKYADGTFGHLIHWGETLNAAESKFYEVLSAAAVSTIPQHTVCLLTADGKLIDSKTYCRNAE